MLWYYPLVCIVLKTADRSHSGSVDVSLLPLAIRTPSISAIKAIILLHVCEGAVRSVYTTSFASK